MMIGDASLEFSHGLIATENVRERETKMADAISAAFRVMQKNMKDEKSVAPELVMAIIFMCATLTYQKELLMGDLLTSFVVGPYVFLSCNLNYDRALGH